MGISLNFVSFSLQIYSKILYRTISFWHVGLKVGADFETKILTNIICIGDTIFFFYYSSRYDYNYYENKAIFFGITLGFNKMVFFPVEFSLSVDPLKLFVIEKFKTRGPLNFFWLLSEVTWAEIGTFSCIFCCNLLCRALLAWLSVFFGLDDEPALKNKEISIKLFLFSFCFFFVF